MPCARLGNDKYKSLSHWFDLTRAQTNKVQITRSPKMGDGHSTYSANHLEPHQDDERMCRGMICGRECSNAAFTRTW